MTLRDAALAWHEAGCFVLPVKADGSKGPAVRSWDTNASAQPRADAEALFDTIDTDGVGLVCGSPSGHLEMLECEGRALKQVGELKQLMADNGLADVWAKLDGGYVEATPSGGIHWLLRTSGPARRNLKLARKANHDVLWETRGQGGFVVVAPSAGRTHPYKGAWLTLRGDPSTVAALTVDERDALYAVVSMLDETEHKEESWSSQPSSLSSPSSRSPSSSDEQRPGDDYEARTTWADILEPLGWKAVQRFGNHGIGWRRPGKDEGISATTGMAADRDRLYVFSTSTVFDTERPYTKFGAFALLEHGGDHASAARALRHDGFGALRGAPADEWSGLLPVPIAVPARAESGDATTQRERTSWWLHSLENALTGIQTDEPPTMLKRSDGALMFYPGRLNGIIGESESGKTWIALETVRQALQDTAATVLYLDFEDSARGIVGRLRAMQLGDETIRRLLYVRPEERLHELAQVDLRELLTLAPTLIVLDGFNAAMTLLGLDLLDNQDATRFAQQILNPLAATGAVVVYVDHVPKNAEQRGKGGIGAQAKRAMTTGCALTVSVEAPFGRGMTGVLHVKVDKDRQGFVRERASGGQYAGKVTLSSDAQSGSVTVQIDAGSQRDPADRADDRLAALMEQCSAVIAHVDGTISGNKVGEALKEKGAKYDKTLFPKALAELVRRGLVSREDVGAAHLYHHIRPYFALDELRGDDDDDDD